MKRLNVVESKRTDDGVVCHVLDTGEERHYASVRAGLSWPIVNSRGFFVILAEEHVAQTRFQDEKRPKGKLVFLTEGQSSTPFLEDIMGPLTDSCTLYLCDTVYAYYELDGEHMEQTILFREYVYSRRINGLCLQQAPFGSDFTIGLSYIRKTLNENRLVLPRDSIVRKQLKALTAEDIAESSVKKIIGKFPAIDALRHSVTAFEKFGTSLSLRGFRPSRKRYSRRGH